MLLAPFQPSARARLATTNSNYTALLSVLLQLSDLVVVALAGLAAHWVRFGQPVTIDDTRNIAIGVLFAAMVFGSSQLYRNWRGMGLAHESFRVLRMWSVAFAATLAFAVALKFANETMKAESIFFYMMLSGLLVVPAALLGVAVEWLLLGPVVGSLVLGNIVAVMSIIAVVSLIQGMDSYVSDAIIKDVGVGTFKMDGRLMLALDVSGSMGASVLGMDHLTCREASAAMALVTLPWQLASRSTRIEPPPEEWQSG